MEARGDRSPLTLPSGPAIPQHTAEAGVGFLLALPPCCPFTLKAGSSDQAPVTLEHFLPSNVSFFSF